MLSVVKSSSLPSHLSDSQMIAWTNAGFAQAVNLFFFFLFIPVIALMAKVSVA